MGARISTSRAASNTNVPESSGPTNPDVPSPDVPDPNIPDPTIPETTVQPDIPEPTVPIDPSLEKQKITYDKNGVIKTHFNLLKTNLYEITAEENNDIRVARSNTYYYKKYKMECNVFIYIIIVCIIINILTLLHKTYPYFDTSAYMIIVGAILGISILVVFYVYFIIMNKDNLNFDEIDYGANISRMHGNSSNTGYVEASFNDISNCIVRDPNNVSKTDFLKKLF